MEPLSGLAGSSFDLRQRVKPTDYAQKPSDAGSRTGEVRGDDRSTSDSSSRKGSKDTSVTLSGEKNLTEEERRQVERLRERDREVRAHEQAHIAAGGSYVRGGANYQYERGPDGKLYAVGGEVSIDTSPIPDNPAATIRKMETIIRAALAPSQPSGQDYQVAARAQMEISRAQMELMQKRGKELYGAVRAFPSAPTDHGREGPTLSLIA